MNIPKHVAIILDGNGRWAKKRLMPRSYGHHQGGKNVFKIAGIACELGIKILTVYAFSTENWNRPQEEIDYLMKLPVEMFEKESNKLDDVAYQIKFMGRKDRIPHDLLEIMYKLESQTKSNDKMILQICFDYGAYDEILNAIEHITGRVTKEKLEEQLMVKDPVDFLIRTSGEVRISNFLLWQISYAELYFTKTPWPAFSKRSLIKAIKVYQKRHRRFGKI